MASVEDYQKLFEEVEKELSRRDGTVEIQSEYFRNIKWKKKVKEYGAFLFDYDRPPITGGSWFLNSWVFSPFETEYPWLYYSYPLSKSNDAVLLDNIRYFEKVFEDRNNRERFCNAIFAWGENNNWLNVVDIYTNLRVPRTIDGALKYPKEFSRKIGELDEEILKSFVADVLREWNTHKKRPHSFSIRMDLSHFGFDMEHTKKLICDFIESTIPFYRFLHNEDSGALLGSRIQ